MTRDEFMEWLCETEDFLVGDEGINQIEIKLDKVYWTAFNQGAITERVRIENGLEIPCEANGWKAKP